jgi:hypothetical protein
LHRLAQALHPEDLRSALMLFEEELVGRVLDCRRFGELARLPFYDAAARHVAQARLNLERAGRGVPFVPSPTSDERDAALERDGSSVYERPSLPPALKLGQHAAPVAP